MTIHLRRAVLTVIAASLSYLVAPLAAADAPNQQTHITLDETLKVPGATLEAGAYVFMLEDNGSRVKIIRASDNKVMTTAKIMRVDRPSDTQGLAIEIAMPRGDAEWPTLKGWSLPEPGGSYEFVFSKSDADRLNDTTAIPISPQG
jgi:hypothetical protein